MTCEDAVVLLHLHRPGERSEEEDRALDLHLRSCARCTAEAGLIQRTMASMDTLTHAPSPSVHVGKETHRIMQAVQQRNRPGVDLMDVVLHLASRPGIRVAYAIVSLSVLAIMTQQLSPQADPSDGMRSTMGPYISYTIDTEPLATITDLPVPASIRSSVLEQETVEIRKADVDRSARMLQGAMFRTLSLTEDQRRIAATVIDGLSRSSALTIRFGRIGG